MSSPKTNGVTPVDAEITATEPSASLQQETSAINSTIEANTPKENDSSIDGEACKALGNKYFQQKEYMKAIEEYSKAILVDPRNATYLSNRAAAYMSAGKYSLALEDCQLADRYQPSVTKTLLRLSRVLLALGRPEEAIETLGRGNLAGTDLVTAQQMAAHIRSAGASLESGNASMTLYALDRAESGLGNGSEIPKRWRLMRGEANLKLGTANSLGEAQNVVMSLLRQNAKDPDALVLRGRILYAQGENSKAAQHFQEALRCDPDFSIAKEYLKKARELERKKEAGNDAFKRNEYENARQLYTEALEVDESNKGTNAKIYQNRALTLIKMKLYVEAIDDCDRAIKLDPLYSKARRTKAKALGQSGDWDEAVKELKSLFESNPQDASLAKEIRQAELEVKKAKRKDYYKILGIEKDANETQIKKAYRQMAIKWHPDKNPNNDEADARFKDIGEAYETLSDVTKRDRYDRGLDIEPDPGDIFGGGVGGGIDPSVLFAAMGGGGGGFSFNTGGAGGHPFGNMHGFPPGGGGRSRGNPFGL